MTACEPQSTTVARLVSATSTRTRTSDTPQTAHVRGELGGLALTRRHSQRGATRAKKSSRRFVRAPPRCRSTRPLRYVFTRTAFVSSEGSWRAIS
jgi:hypothetical protein